MTGAAESTVEVDQPGRVASGVDVAGGDEGGLDAFDDFVRSAAGDLGRVAWVLTLDRDDAADLVQEALARALARWPRIWASGEDPFPYVRRILVNLRTDQWRRRQHRQSAERRWVGRAPVAGVEADPAHVARDDEFLGSALASLTERQRRVVALRYLQDLSIEDTAATLGISQAAVKMAASRALVALRGRMEGSGRG